MNLPCLVAHAVLFEQREDGHVHRCHAGCDLHARVALVVFHVLVVGMVQNMPDDAVDAERRFDDVGQVPFAGFLDGLLIGLHVFGFHRDHVTVAQIHLAREHRRLGQRFHGGFHRSCQGFERRSSLGTVNGPRIDDSGARLGEFTPGTEGFPGGFLVCLKVVTATVSNANTFHPTVAALNFSVPAIHGIVGHFIGFVLPETDTLRVDANVREEAVRPPDELSDRGVAHHAFVKRVLQGGVRLRLAVGYECKVHLTKFTQVAVDRCLGVNEVLQFRHVEFPQANHALARGDFVAVTFANLDGTERQPFPKVAEQGVERGEHALSRFGSQESLTAGCTGPDGGVEHQILGLNRAPFGGGTRRAGGKGLVQQALEVVLAQGVRVRVVRLKQHVCTTGFLAGPTNGHEIGKLADVTARFKHSVGRDGGAGKFHDVAHLQPVVEPCLVDA